MPLAMQAASEPDLEATLRGLALAQLPSRFYQLLNLALPLGIQLATWGWYRSAGWMFAISAFGIWALCEKRCSDSRDSGSKATLVRALRGIAGATAIVLGGVLSLELFVHVLSVFFRCPGCAG